MAFAQVMCCTMYLKIPSGRRCPRMTVPPAAPSPEQRPSNARMYDYFLGGYHNFAVDRAAAEGILAAPSSPFGKGKHTYTDSGLGRVKIETDENFTGIGPRRHGARRPGDDRERSNTS